MKKPLIVFSSIILSVAADMPLFAQAKEEGRVVRMDAALDSIVPPGAKVEKLAGNLGFIEGPVWVRKGDYLLFGDILANVIEKWSPSTGMISIVRERAGFTGSDPSVINIAGQRSGPGVGPNGITLDSQGRIVYCARGDRGIMRIEADGRRTVLASEYDGKKLTKPNDLVYKSNGSLYFTDPFVPNEDLAYPWKNFPLSGVYLLKGGKLVLLTKDMPNPNGLTLSADEKYLYVNDTTKKTIMRYDVRPDDTIANGKVFVDMSTGQPSPTDTGERLAGGPDGMKVDRRGNVYCTGPGGVWIISPEGKRLGTIAASELPSNVAFGDADGKTLYMTARTGLYRIRLKIAGVHP